MMPMDYIKFFTRTFWVKKASILGAAGGSFLILKVMLFFQVEAESWQYWIGIIVSTLLALWPFISSAIDSCKEKDYVKKIIIITVGFIVTVLVCYQLLKEFSL